AVARATSNQVGASLPVRGVVPRKARNRVGLFYEECMANEIARKLRKTMTPQEVKLWVKLRELRALGHHFRRQSPMLNYIVDFECRRSRVIVARWNAARIRCESATRSCAGRDLEARRLQNSSLCKSG